MDGPGGPDKLPDDLALIDRHSKIAYNVTMDRGKAHGSEKRDNRKEKENLDKHSRDVVGCSQAGGNRRV